MEHARLYVRWLHAINLTAPPADGSASWWVPLWMTSDNASGTGLRAKRSAPRGSGFGRLFGLEFVQELVVAEGDDLVAFDHFLAHVVQARPA